MGLMSSKTGLPNNCAMERTRSIWFAEGYVRWSS
jgi:hypothetical protein